LKNWVHFIINTRTINSGLSLQK